MTLARRIPLAHVQQPTSEPVPDADDPESPTQDVAREWLVTNAFGGYAYGTVSGIITRRYHGVLIAALPAPLGRTNMLQHLAELLHLPGGAAVMLGCQQRPNAPESTRAARLIEFRLELGLPVWRFEHAGFVLERRVHMPHAQNTTIVTYEVCAGDGEASLELAPWINFRAADGPLHAAITSPYTLQARGDLYEVWSEETRIPRLRMATRGECSAFRIDGRRIRNVRYQIERARGYDAQGDLYSPGVFCTRVARDKPASFVASTEAWEMVTALTPEEAARLENERRVRLLGAAAKPARSGVAAELVLGADQVIVSPAGRIRDAARAHAAGDETRTVIAGYPWFTDWGRDTMISLEGLTLVTGRHLEAAFILRTFADYVKDGLIPNMFPEGDDLGLYHTADATLWFVHAIDRYLTYTHDHATLRLLLPTLRRIFDAHFAGTRFGIRVDPKDGLLAQGAPGYQLTWMDAKVGDYVVTPRRGKAVEINALFYNALRLMQQWVRAEDGESAAQRFDEAAERARASFNERFWFAAGGHLYDVVDGEHGDDASFRPNQLLAVSLPYAILDRARWPDIVEKVEKRLVTPLGLRSLAPGEPEYKSRYFGDLRARDMAYHQGTVWAWLIGPFVDAWLKVHPGERARARLFLRGFEPHLSEACVGSISEIFDADAPYTPRGCVAQAWSVAEVLRALVKTGDQ
jgi:predicted glycogen debranching enzyme